MKKLISMVLVLAGCAPAFSQAKQAFLQTRFVVGGHRDTNILKDDVPVRLIVCNENRIVIDSMESKNGWFDYTPVGDLTPHYLFFRAKGCCPIIVSVYASPDNGLAIILSLERDVDCSSMVSGVHLISNVKTGGTITWEEIPNH